MKRIFLLIILGLFSLHGRESHAQLLSVTATLTDSDSTLWKNCSISAQINSPNGTPMFGTTAVPQGVIVGTCDGSAVVGIGLYNTNTITPTGATYNITICSNTSARCTQIIQLPITATNQTTPFSSRLVAPRFSALPGAFGYNDTEVAAKTIGQGYFNVSTPGYEMCDGTNCAAIGGGGGGGTTCATTTNLLAGNGTAGGCIASGIAAANVALLGGTNAFTAINTFSAQLRVASTPTVGLSTATDSTTGIEFFGAGFMGLVNSGTSTSVFGPAAYGVAANLSWGWMNNNNAAAGSCDTGFSRDAGGGTAVDLGNCTANNKSGTLSLNVINANTFNNTDTVNNTQMTYVVGSGGTATCPINGTSGSFTACDIAGVPSVSVASIASGAYQQFLLGTNVQNATTTFGTTTINANSCSSTTTVTMTGVTSSMTFGFTPNADISGITGWGEGLRVSAWPTANTLNYKVCNVTGSNITTGASVTFNVSAK